MFGIILGLQSLLLRGVADVAENRRINKENYDDRIRKQEKYNNKTDFSGTYFSNDGLRDVFTNERVQYRTNEHLDRIIFSLETKKDIRNVSQLKREYELQKNIEKANKENKTVALKLSKYNALNLYYKTPYEKHINEVFKVEDYPLEHTRFILSNNKNNPNYVAGDRYYDIMSGKEFVIRVFQNKDKTKKTYFYMNTKDGHLERRTDNQIINDQNYPEDNYIEVNQTELFIKEFNEMQDKNKTLLNKNDFNILFWHNDKDSKDCFIKENNKNVLYKMKHFEV